MDTYWRTGKIAFNLIPDQITNDLFFFLKPYPCSFCSKSFRRTHHLKKHMDATHGPDSYENAKKVKNDLNSADLDDDDFGEEEEEFEYKQEEEFVE